MANYDGHLAKRQRTDENAQRGGGYNYYNRGKGEREEQEPNHILLMTILNPMYPITVDVIHTISSASGKVLRIVIFKKNGVQAMVEFESIDVAKRAKSALDGADIYSGCCTLKIDYAKPSRLNVHKNDSESWDYTNTGMGGPGKQNDRPALLDQPPRGFGGGPGGPFRDGGRGGPGGYSPMDRMDPYENYGRPFPGYGADPYGPPDRGYPAGDRSFGGGDYDRHMGGPGGRYNEHGGPEGAIPQQGSVCMVYGLNHEKVNCDRLFNLFCLYGNVIRVKFLKSKEGCAMVQMGDAASVERALHNLNGAFFFANKIQVGYSKQAYLNDVQQPHDLPDGTPSFKDYMGNRNNRFTNPDAAGKNRIQPPSRVLHFFNTPFGVDEEEMKKLFEDQEVAPPKSVKLFPSKTERSSSGLLEFEGVSDALEALVVVNHYPITKPSKYPYILKLCFSSANPNKFG
jgi:heterogeneous nuclear ribonucleoprotein L